MAKPKANVGSRETGSKKEKVKTSPQPQKEENPVQLEHKKGKAKLKTSSNTVSTAGSKGQSQSCHQCRQSIYSHKGVSEVKYGKERLRCSKCTRFWCQQCLLNRYGLIKDALDPNSWQCAVCNKKCNCSVCRKKEGKLATGILTPLAKNAGFQSVSDFLDKGTDDIAKVLQWKSPTSTSSKSPAREKEKKSVGAENSNRRKKAVPKKSEAEGSSINQQRSTKRSPKVAKAVPSIGTNRRGRGLRCHGDDIVRGCIKRRRLDHSVYNITIDEEDYPLIRRGPEEYEIASPEDYYTGMATNNPVTERKNRFVTPEPTSPRPPTLKGEAPSSSPALAETMSSPALEEESVSSPFSQSLEDPLPPASSTGKKERLSPFRRSSRERKLTRRYSTDDYEVDFTSLSETQNVNSEPDVVSIEKNVDSDTDTVPAIARGEDGSTPNKTPIFRFKLPMDKRRLDLERSKKLEELSSLKVEKMCSIRKSRIARVHKELDKIAHAQEWEAEEVAPMEMERNDEERLREEEKRIHAAAMEKVRNARNLLRDAQKDLLRHQRERERVAKQLMLNELKEKKLAMKRTVQEMINMPLTTSVEEVSLTDDSPESCVSSGIPSLPDLPLFPYPIPKAHVRPFLFVAEFLHTFHESLGLKKRIAANELCTLVTNGRGSSEVYKRLLKIIMTEDSDLKKKLGSSRKQKDLEKLAKKYLQERGRNGFRMRSAKQSVEESLIILNHLCQDVLDTGFLEESMEDSRLKADQLQRDQRLKEKEKSKDIGEELRKVYDGGGGGVLMEEVQSRKKEITNDLEKMRKDADMEHYSCSLSMRNSPLGTDRHGRIYWKMQSVPGVIVESVSPVEGEEEESKESKAWYIIDSADMLAKLSECLHPRGMRENKLLQSLQFHTESMVYDA